MSKMQRKIEDRMISYHRDLMITAVKHASELDLSKPLDNIMYMALKEDYIRHRSYSELVGNETELYHAAFSKAIENYKLIEVDIFE